MSPIGTMDPSSLTVSVGETTARLTGSQYAVFDALYRAKGRTLSKELLTDVMEGVTRHDINSNVAEVQIHRIRQKLKPLGLEIVNSRGRGFRLPKTEFEVLTEIEWAEDLPSHRQVQEASA